ncbi:MAG: TraR/DksA family transcriptional regulator [Deltaproteobacteria bacterium]|nr:TraR/DksA family transcriptional regulator [Deltaproteobacteria bacterium]
MPNKESNRQVRLRDVLVEEKRRMWAALREDVFKKLGKEYGEQFSSPQDLEDLATLDIIEDKGLVFADMRRKELEALEDALRRLDEGTYGACVECGREIDLERLKVMPFAGSCVECKARSEGGKKPSL